MVTKPVLVGLSVTNETEVGLQLAPLDYNKTGSRIMRLLDMNEDSYYRKFSRVNVCPHPRSGVIDSKKVRYDVLNLMGVLAERQCILLGQNVAGCFGVGPADYEYCRWYAGNYDLRHYSLGLPLPFDWAVMPHPSGLNRWYNSLENTEMAAQFLSEAVG